MPVSAAREAYTREAALRLVGVSERQLRSWEKLGLLSPATSYDFRQLIALRTLARLRAARLPTRKIQQAVSALRRRLRGVNDPLTELRLYTEGSRIRVQVGGQAMESESGQLLLDFGAEELERMAGAAPTELRAPEGSVQRRHREAESWFVRGLELEQNGGAANLVVEAYEKAVELNPQLAAAHVNLGTVYFGMRRWDRAEKCYRRAIEANPDYALAHFNLANLYDEAGERTRALTHYQTALKLDPGYADAHYNIALLYQLTGNVMKAMRHWRAYLKLDPASAWADIARRELEKLYAATVVSPGPKR